jgi:polysaccharide export outer membrane protein
MRNINATLSSVSMLLMVLLMAASCVSRSGPSAGSIAQGYANASPESEVNEINSELLTRSAPSHSSQSDYIIGPSDLIEVKVFESEKLTTTERVGADGYINLPLIDNVQVNGLTPIRVEEKIEMLLKDGGYINNPHVSIFVLEHKSNTVSVLGYVNEPGNYELIGKVTLLDALAFAKGLDKDAGTTVYIATERNGRQEKIMVDLNDLFERTGPSDQVNLVISSGDKIYVPEAFKVFVDGAISEPGSYPIDDGQTTLSQVITMAGGPSSIANKGDVSLIRYLSKGSREIVQVDLNSIEEGTMQDPVLYENDAIVVGKSGFKSFFYGLNVMMFGFGAGYHPPAR